ncbi:unnamed protein product [Amoebophrya sp. A120]|nr:unnamed protein product [Amoebophrya sp. A120]|eukprot:GSA120T00002019001.1
MLLILRSYAFLNYVVGPLRTASATSDKKGSLLCDPDLYEDFYETAARYSPSSAFSRQTTAGTQRRGIKSCGSAGILFELGGGQSSRDTSFSSLPDNVEYVESTPLHGRADEDGFLARDPGSEEPSESAYCGPVFERTLSDLGNDLFAVPGRDGDAVADPPPNVEDVAEEQPPQEEQRLYYVGGNQHWPVGVSAARSGPEANYQYFDAPYLPQTPAPRSIFGQFFHGQEAEASDPNTVEQGAMVRGRSAGSRDAASQTEALSPVPGQEGVPEFKPFLSDVNAGFWDHAGGRPHDQESVPKFKAFLSTENAGFIWDHAGGVPSSPSADASRGETSGSRTPDFKPLGQADFPHVLGYSSHPIQQMQQAQAAAQYQSGFSAGCDPSVPAADAAFASPGQPETAQVHPEDMGSKWLELFQAISDSLTVLTDVLPQPTGVPQVEPAAPAFAEHSLGTSGGVRENLAQHHSKTHWSSSTSFANREPVLSVLRQCGPQDGNARAGQPGRGEECDPYLQSTPANAHDASTAGPGTATSSRDTSSLAPTHKTSFLRRKNAPLARRTGSGVMKPLLPPTVEGTAPAFYLDGEPVPEEWRRKWTLFLRDVSGDSVTVANETGYTFQMVVVPHSAIEKRFVREGPTVGHVRSWLHRRVPQWCEDILLVMNPWHQSGNLIVNAYSDEVHLAALFFSPVFDGKQLLAPKPLQGQRLARDVFRASNF